MNVTCTSILILFTHWPKCLMCQCIFRWLAAVKVSHGANKDMLTAAAKAETLKEEYEEETAKFEACQVRLSVEFYTH